MTDEQSRKTPSGSDSQSGAQKSDTKQSKAAARDARLATRLRENLKKRKDLGRARKSSE